MDNEYSDQSFRWAHMVEGTFSYGMALLRHLRPEKKASSERLHINVLTRLCYAQSAMFVRVLRHLTACALEV